MDSVFATLDIQKIKLQLEGILRHDINPKTDILFLDEIQATPNAIAALRYFYEEMSELLIIAAGSLLEFALAEENFSMPVGRIEYMHIFPMTSPEFLTARNQIWLKEKLDLFSQKKIKVKHWTEELHRQLIDQLTTYMFMGGMPEVVQQFTEQSSFTKLKKISENISTTYMDDFHKYAKRNELTRLQQIYRKLPYHIGKKIKYSELLGEEKSINIKHCIQLLHQARIIEHVHHSNCSGLPVTAQKDFNVYKVFWLDIGLLNFLQGLTQPISHEHLNSIFKGTQAEQFVAQQMLASQDTSMRPELFYWLREGKTGNAEIDFVLQLNSEIIPIEVKSTSAGQMKSLHQFIYEKKAK